MIVGFDYWQVISDYPEYMAALWHSLKNYPNEVHIVSSVGTKRAGTMVAAVRYTPGFETFPSSRVHEVVFEHPLQAPELKLAKCRDLGIAMFFDDREDICKLLSQNGIMVMQVHRKPKTAKAEYDDDLYAVS